MIYFRARACIGKTLCSMRRLLLIYCNSFAILISAINSYPQRTEKNMPHKNINGLSIAYQLTGKGPALILLHGFTIDSRVWKPQLDSLSKKFTVIAWDAPGAGQSSDPPEGFTMNDWADCLAGLLDSVGVKQAHILGLSWGGILAQVFYKRHHQRTLSLILVDTYAGWKGSLPERIADERVQACLRDASLSPGEFVAKYIPGMFSDSVTLDVKEELANIMSDFHPVGFRLMVTDLAKVNTKDLLPTIRVPTLLIWGENDKRSPITVAHQFRDAIPGAKLVIIPKAGHVSNLEQRNQFNKIVNEFCLSLSTK
jgi:pimeloyl-ACP methyl ester carboxylesterase